METFANQFIGQGGNFPHPVTKKKPLVIIFINIRNRRDAKQIETKVGELRKIPQVVQIAVSTEPEIEKRKF